MIDPKFFLEAKRESFFRNMILLSDFMKDRIFQLLKMFSLFKFTYRIVCELLKINELFRYSSFLDIKNKTFEHV